METFTLGQLGAALLAAASAVVLLSNAAEKLAKAAAAARRPAADQTKRIITLENGVRAMLRNDLIKLADKYLDEGEIPVYAMETVTAMYEAYHALGGNGTITKLVEEVKRLPTRH